MIPFPVNPGPKAPEEEGTWTFEVAVPAASGYFDGHFPGNPILPGVAQLALCDQLVRAAIGSSTHLAGIRTLRFKSTVAPGDELTVRLRRALRPGELNLTILRGTDEIAAGAVLLAEDGTKPEGTQ